MINPILDTLDNTGDTSNSNLFDSAMLSNAKFKPEARCLSGGYSTSLLESDASNPLCAFPGGGVHSVKQAH